MPDDRDPAADIEWLLADIATRRHSIGVNRAYYDGDQQLRFATSHWRNTFGQVFKEATDNLCAPVVDAVVERLNLEGFDGPAADRLAPLWQTARVPRLQTEIHLEACTTGDAFTIVWPSSANVPTVWPQAADTCAVDYDPEQLGVIRKGGKVWRQSPTEWRATLYYPDRLLRFKADVSKDDKSWPKAGKFVPLPDDQDPMVPNVWGVVPFAHYGARAKLGGYGRSELEAARPIQDMLNKSVMDLLVGMEYAALPQRYGIGVEKPRDPVTGLEIEGDVKAGIDRLWTVKSKDAKLGQFDAANLNQILEVVESFRLEMARVSGTPPQYFFAGQNDWPAGVTLGRLESRLVHKCKDRHRTYGDGHTQTGILLLAQSGRGAVKPDALTPRWTDPSMPDPLTQLEIAEAKRRVGVSERQVLKELGYDEATIDEMMMENRLASQPFDDAMADEAGAQAAAGLSAAELRARADAAGVLIRAGVDQAAALARVGLAGLELSGAVPVSLRLPEADAANLETS